MTNGEKYKTAEERESAYIKYLTALGYGDVSIGKFAWLDLEAEEEKPLPCPFCGRNCNVINTIFRQYYFCECSYERCLYGSGRKTTRDEAIAAHNRVCKAVKAYKESEVSNA